MKALLWFKAQWGAHGTKYLGAIQGTIAAIAGVGGLIPESQLKYWLGASSLLVFWRGFVNSGSR